MQEIYINLDDSGKLSSKEQCCVYGGIIFFSKQEKDKFINIYRDILNSFKCHYCQKKCDKKCPEIKNNCIRPKDKRRIINLLKKYYIIGLVINNKKVYTYIINDKKAKGRYLDYGLRRLIKASLIDLIKKGSVNNNDLKIIINIDEQPTKSNGYYNLKEGIFEELKHGISNFNYGYIFRPIIKNRLDVSLTYIDSKNSIAVQAADIIAGTLRKNYIENRNTNIVTFKLKMPK